MATSKPSHQLYRSLLRQYKDASVQPRTSRSPSIASALRRLFDGKAGATAAPSDAGGITARQVSDLAGYMKANRLHSDLVKRYNPGTDLTEPERIKATANRVGLNVPKPLDLNTPLEAWPDKKST